jgi:hypothetical protein
MKTLVYFASGPIKEEYKDLDFDRIYLIDNCFRRGERFTEHSFFEGKIVCVGMDCLESIRYLLKENVRINYFVSLNEGFGEGGGSYAINSDIFLGYAMPLFKEQYIHIMNKNYYHNSYNVSDNIPKVINIHKVGIDGVFNLCSEGKLETIGFTPFGRGSYKGFLRKLEWYKKDYPKKILMFHLNKNDYREIKKSANNKVSGGLFY